MSEPYDRKKELERVSKLKGIIFNNFQKEREEGKKKMQEAPFLSSSVKNSTFANDKETYGLIKPLPEVKDYE